MHGGRVAYRVPGEDLVVEPRHDGGDSDVPAGFTYLGQFITHVITFDRGGDFLPRGPSARGLHLETARSRADAP
jgi:hypothetical protein